MTTMRTFLLACGFLMCASCVALAHPGVGIVRDPQGNVFYTDLQHVWRIAPNGRVSIAVRDVHTHELALDSAGALYGEDSEYLGGDRWRHRIWRRRADGRLEDVSPWRNTFFREYGFVGDARGSTYWPQCLQRGSCVIRRRSQDGRVTNLVPGTGRFESPIINSIAAMRSGALYVVDGDALKVLQADGRMTTRVRALGGAPMGLWVAPDDAVYVAVYARRVVLRVDTAGRSTVIARTPEHWGPSGVTRAPNGDLWILEYSDSNAARVRRVTTRGATRVFRP